MATIDLKTLQKWATLTKGEHTLQIVARADNHIDSDKSAPIEFTRYMWSISDSINPRATRLVLGAYNVVNGELGTLANSHTMDIEPGMIIPTPDTSTMENGVKFIGWFDDGTFDASDLSAIKHGDSINPLSDRYGAVWQSETYASKDDVPALMTIDETAKAFATIKFNFANVLEGTAEILVATSGYPNAYNATTMKVASTASYSDVTVDLASWETTLFAESGILSVPLAFSFTAFDLDNYELGATEPIEVESVSTETTTEIQAEFIEKAYDYKFTDNVLQIYRAPYTFTDGTVRIGG